MSGKKFLLRQEDELSCQFLSFNEFYFWKLNVWKISQMSSVSLPRTRKQIDNMYISVLIAVTVDVQSAGFLISALTVVVFGKLI